jgi:hypothetical protein
LIRPAGSPWERHIRPPNRTVGREAIRDLLQPNYEAAKKAGRRIIEYRDLRMHETIDPELIVAEFELIGLKSEEDQYATGSSRSCACVGVRSSRCVFTSIPGPWRTGWNEAQTEIKTNVEQEPAQGPEDLHPSLACASIDS